MKQKKPSVSSRLRAVENDMVLMKNWINSTGADTARLCMATDRALEAYAIYQGELENFHTYLKGLQDNEQKEKPASRQTGKKKPTKRSGTSKTSSKSG
mgnify:CR=1 FL=1|tara:strand:+ start:299 stop:592 length:294 start_codon:yes stop_codon:yes gene_type:complete